jgi:release factor glutamine methyltransferase
MDTNPYAVELAHANFKRNQHKLTGNFEVRKSDLFSAVKNYEKFNIIIFNPPYLPTSDREKIGGWFDVAVDGGEDGLKIIKRFLQDLKRHLEKNGRAYFVFSSLSNKEKLQKYIENTGLKYEIAATLRFNSETIEIYHLKQTNQDLYQKEPLNVKKQGAAR